MDEVKINTTVCLLSNILCSCASFLAFYSRRITYLNLSENCSSQILIIYAVYLDFACLFVFFFVLFSKQSFHQDCACLVPI